MSGSRLSMLFVALVLVACNGLAEDATGAEIYSHSCARCHGAQLEGNVGPALDAGSDAAEGTDEYLTTTISRGLGRMPSFSSSLSDQQIERVVEYLREQQGR